MAGAISHFISCETVPWTSSVTSLSYRAGKQLDRSSELGVWVQTSQSIVRLAAAGLKNRYNWMSSFQNIRKEQARAVAITASTSDQEIKRVTMHVRRITWPKLRSCTWLWGQSSTVDTVLCGQGTTEFGVGPLLAPRNHVLVLSFPKHGPCPKV